MTGIFQRRKNFREVVKNTIFVEVFAAPKDATPPDFAGKTFANNHKTVKFSIVFSLKSFPLYGI